MIFIIHKGILIMLFRMDKREQIHFCGTCERKIKLKTKIGCYLSN